MIYPSGAPVCDRLEWSLTAAPKPTVPWLPV